MEQTSGLPVGAKERSPFIEVPHLAFLGKHWSAIATDVGDGDDCHRAVHADDAGVDRRLHPLQRRMNSRSPIILISALAKVLMRSAPVVSTSG